MIISIGNSKESTKRKPNQTLRQWRKGFSLARDHETTNQDESHPYKLAMTVGRLEEEIYHLQLVEMKAGVQLTARELA